MNAFTLKSAAAAAALVLLTGAPALAQAIMSNAVTETTPVLVTINGGKPEHTGQIGYGEEPGVHPGRNTLTVRWAGAVKRIDFRITNNAKDVLIVRLDAAHNAALRRAGSRTYTFTIP